MLRAGRLSVMIVLMLALLASTACAKVRIDASSFQWSEPGFAEWWREVTAAFNAQHPDIEVYGHDIPYNDYWDQMAIRLQAGNPPDIVVMGASLQSYILMDKFEPLNKYFEADEEGRKILSMYSDVALDFCSRDGKVYMLPLQTLVHGSVFYNKRMFDEAGVEVPKTPEEFLEAAKKLTKRDAAGNIVQYGYAVNTPPSLYFWFSDLRPWVLAFGGEFTKDGKVTIDTPEVRAAVEFIKRLYDAQVSPRQVSMEAAKQLFWEEKSAMTIDVGTMGAWSILENPAIRPYLGTFPTPGTNGMTQPMGICIAKDSPYKEQVWEFFKFAAQPEWQARGTELSLTLPGLSVAPPEQVIAEYPYLKVHFEDIAQVTQHSTIPSSLAEHYERLRRVMVDAMADILFNNAPIDATLKKAQAEAERQIY